jgi:hypothetical protein
MKLGTLVHYHGYAQGRSGHHIWMIIERHDREREKYNLNSDHEYTILDLKTGKTRITHWSNVTQFDTGEQK